jgi:hypothetical protein
MRRTANFARAVDGGSPVLFISWFRGRNHWLSPPSLTLPLIAVATRTQNEYIAHMQNRPKPISALGYTKHRGASSEPNKMIVEAQHQTRFGKAGKNEAGVFIRVGVAPKRSDCPLDDLVENSAQLTLDQARAFAEWIVAEVAEAQRTLGKFGKK